VNFARCLLRTMSSELRKPRTAVMPKVATEMALHVLAYNITRVMNIVGIKPLLTAVRA
jgi:hypothetical protein